MVQRCEVWPDINACCPYSVPAPSATHCFNPITGMVPNPEQQKADFARHRAEPEVSVDDHLRRKQIALTQSLERRKIVYLDIWVWNRISDHVLKGTADPTIAGCSLRLKRAMSSAR